MDLWDSPRQREAYDWFTVELANLRTAFRWAADHADLDTGAAIAAYAALLGPFLENYEPITWAEELIEPLRAIEHPRLAAVCVGASLCCVVGRFKEAVLYSEVGQTVIAAASDKVSYFGEPWLGTVYLFVGRPDFYLELCRAQLRRSGEANTFARVHLVSALAICDLIDEAMVNADGLTDAAEAGGNPMVLGYALAVCGNAFRDADPDFALEAWRRSVLVAHDSGNRMFETQFAVWRSGVEAEHGERLVALNSLDTAIHNMHESGGGGMLHNALAILTLILDGLERYEPAATIAGFATANPIAAVTMPELGAAITHLRQVLAEATYESLARRGKTMTISAIVTYAYDQIDQARTKLDAVAE
jgi:hypothetical protein